MTVAFRSAYTDFGFAEMLAGRPTSLADNFPSSCTGRRAQGNR